jgi:hypothetical protein
VRTIRNVAIIAILAVPVAFVPGGGGLGAVIWVTLMACAVIAIIGIWMRAHTY